MYISEKLSKKKIHFSSDTLGIFFMDFFTSVCLYVWYVHT